MENISNMHHRGHREGGKKKGMTHVNPLLGRNLTSSSHNALLQRLNQREVIQPW